MHPNLQSILSKYQANFSSPHGLTPSRGVHYHCVPLVLGSLPTSVLPYRHPFS
jgi:hypothetical protein